MVNLHAVSWGLSEELFLSLILQPGNKQVMAKLLVGKDTKKPRYKGFSWTQNAKQECHDPALSDGEYSEFSTTLSITSTLQL